MAFPAIQDADTKSGGTTTGSTTATITYPTNIAAGDLLICVVAISNNAGLTGWPAGWTQMRVGATAPSFEVRYKIAAGTETGTFNLTVSTSSLVAFFCYRITGAHASTAPEASSAASSTNVNPDPGSEDPAGWALEDTLWLATCVYANGTTTVTGFPTNYTNGANPRGNNASGVGIGVARRSLQATSDDPGSFTLSVSRLWRAVTIAVRPAFTAFTLAPTGTITPTGAERADIGKPVAGSVAPAGVVPKLVGSSLAGLLAPAGSDRALFAKSLAGSLTPAGAERGALGKFLVGSLAPAGTRSSAVGKFLAGTIAPSGFADLVADIAQKVLDVGGSITPTGNVAKAITREPFTGSVAPSGSLHKTIALAFLATLDPSGVFSTEQVRILGGQAPTIADSIPGFLGDSVSDGHIEEPESIVIGGP